MYHHVKVKIYNKEVLYDAIRKCFDAAAGFTKVSGGFSIVVSKLPYGVPGENFLLTQQQRDQLNESPTRGYTANLLYCHHDQIISYAHSCIDRPTLLRIIEGENP